MIPTGEQTNELERIGIRNTSRSHGHLSEQFKGPLAEKPAGLSDDGERETVMNIAEVLEQILATFDPAKEVAVSAYGHMGFADYDAKTGCYQQVSITVVPKS